MLYIYIYIFIYKCQIILHSHQQYVGDSFLHLRIFFLLFCLGNFYLSVHWFIWVFHSAVEPFYWVFNLVIVISIWFLLISSISLLSRSIFLFTIRVLIIIEAFVWCLLHVCVRILLPMVSWYCPLLIVFFIQFEIFLVLDIMSNLLLQPGTLWYCIMRLWYLFKFCFSWLHLTPP